MRNGLQKKNILYYTACILAFLITGFELGVLPFGEMMVNGLMYCVIGQANTTNLDSLFQLSYLNQLIPYGMRIPEEFGVFFLARIIALTGISEFYTVQIEAFIFYCAAFVCMLIVLNRSSGNRIIALIVTMVFFWNPVLRAQQGVPPIYFGILFMPVVLLVLFFFNRHIEQIMSEREGQSGIKKKNVFFIAGNFAVFLILASTSWYLAVISASGVCLYYLVFYASFFKRYQSHFGKICWIYLEYILLPWVVALGIILLMTPTAVSQTRTAFDFMNGSSIDVLTMMLPGSVQAISRFFSVESVIAQNKFIPGNGVAYYFGYSILILLLISIFWKNARSRKSLSLFIAGSVLLLISLGPGLRVAAMLDKSMLQVTGQYRLPLEENVVQFPWGIMFDKFPLNIMRAVSRWYIGAVFFFLILAARTLGRLGAKRRGRIVAYVLCFCMVLEFFPRIGHETGRRTQYFRDYKHVYNDCVKELDEFLSGKSARLAFCNYDYNSNTYMIPMIMTKLEGCMTYSGAGDKSIEMARGYRPECVSDFMCSAEPEAIAINISRMGEYHLTDYAILPYFDLSNAVYQWPMNDEIIERTTLIAEDVAARLRNRYRVVRLEHYMVIELATGENVIDILADKTADNAEFLMQDEGFGTKYAINTEGMQYEQTVEPGDDSVYLNYILKSCDTEEADLFIEYIDRDGVVTGEEKITVPVTEQYKMAELQMEIPENTGRVRYYFDSSGVYLKKFYAIPYDQSKILKGDVSAEVEELTGLSVESMNNIVIGEGEMIFSENSFLSLDAGEEFDGRYLQLEMDIFMSSGNEHISGFEIANKWGGWLDEMTFALAYHEDEQIFYFNISGNGREAVGWDWSLQEMKKDEWNKFKFCFDHGNVLLFVNGNCVAEQACGFDSLYVSREPIRIGNGFTGKIRNFSFGSLADQG